MSTELFSNNAASTLNGSITAAATTLLVVSAAAFPLVSQFRIMIDSEIMLVTAVSSNTFTVTRGAESTTAAAHNNGATVNQALTAGALSLFVQTTDLTTGDLFYASATNTLSKRGIGSTGNVLSVVAGVPAWAALNLAGGSAYISNTLPVGNGGTGVASYTAGDLLYASGTTTLSKLAKGSVDGGVLLSGTTPAWSTVTVESSGRLFLLNGITIAQVGTASTNALAYFAGAGTGFTSSIRVRAHVGASNVGPNFVGEKARGTAASPTAALADDDLCYFGGIGYADTGIGTSTAGLRVRASETWTASVQGSYLALHTTPTGSTTQLQRVMIGSNGYTGFSDVSAFTNQATAPGFVAHVSTNTNGTALGIDQFSGDSGGAPVVMRKGRGTFAAPLRALLNDDIGVLVARPWYAATDVATATFSASNVGAIKMTAAESATSTAQGTYITLGTTPVTTIVRKTRMMVGADGCVGISDTDVFSTQATTPGFNLHVATSSSTTSAVIMVENTASSNGSFGGFAGRKANGSTAPTTNECLTYLASRAWNGSAWNTNNNAVIKLFAAESQASNHGTYITLETTPTGGSSTRAIRMMVGSDGLTGISDNSAFTTQATTPGFLLNLSSNTSSTIFADLFLASAGSPSVVGRKGRGTFAAPTRALINDSLLTIFGRSWYAATDGGAATAGTINTTFIKFAAAEAQDSVTALTGFGSYMIFGTTPVGSTSRQDRMMLGANGFLGISDNSAYTSQATTPAALFSLSSDTLTNINTDVFVGSTTAPNIIFRKARGTFAAPRRALADDFIGALLGRSWIAASDIVDATASTTSSAHIAFSAAANATSTEQGTYITLGTIAVGDTGLTRKVRMMIGSNGYVGHSDNAAFTTQATTPGYPIHVSSDTQALISLDTYNASATNSARFMGRSARGTFASYTATQSGDILTMWQGNGCTGANTWGTANPAAILFYAIENFAAGTQGTAIVFATTPVTTATRAEAMRIGGDGILQWSIAGNVQTTVGVAGGADALPASPTKYLKIKDSTGTTYVVPAFLPS